MKDEILSKVGSYAILNFYLAPYHNLGPLRQGKHISNPFLPKRQSTPSFNIYKANGKWYYKDFATSDQGDCFELVMRLNRCDFKTALNLIKVDFNL